jgi:hypothetical protein
MNTTIDNVTSNLEWIEKYELPKMNILDRFLKGLRVVQAMGDTEGMKKEMDVLDNILRRIDAVIPGEMNRFKGNAIIMSQLSRQRLIINALKEDAARYKGNTDIGRLNEIFNYISNGITSFITLSKSMINIRSVQKKTA